MYIFILLQILCALLSTIVNRYKFCEYTLFYVACGLKNRNFKMDGTDSESASVINESKTASVINESKRDSNEVILYKHIRLTVVDNLALYL